MTKRATFGYTQINGAWFVCTFDDQGNVEAKWWACSSYDEAVNTANGYNGGWMSPPPTPI